MQHRFLAVDDQGVARIVPALKPNDRRRPIGQQIDDLALSFVTPLAPMITTALLT